MIQASNTTVNILNATPLTLNVSQLNASQGIRHSCQHVIKCQITTELSICHEHINHCHVIVMSVIDIVMFTICHVSHLQNFERVINTKVLSTPLSIILSYYYSIIISSLGERGSVRSKFYIYIYIYIYIVLVAFLTWKAYQLTNLRLIHFK